MKNEKTGTKAASISGRILNKIQKSESKSNYSVVIIGDNGFTVVVKLCNVGELQTALGSTLTQAPDKKKPTKRGVKK